MTSPSKSGAVVVDPNVLYALRNLCEVDRDGSNDDKGILVEAPCRLFRQGDPAGDTEVAGDTRRSGIWLAAADTDGVITVGDDRMALVGHHAQVSVLELKMNLLTCARFEMDALES